MEIVLTFIGLVAGVSIGFLLGRGKGSAAEARLTMLTDENAKLREQNSSQADSLSSLNVKVGEFRTRAELAEKHIDEQKSAFEKQLADQKEQHENQLKKELELVSSQLKNESEKILRERSEELTKTNEERLGAILNPLRENIKTMKEAVEKSDRQHSVTMERLGATIEQTMNLSREVGERADRLANAMTNENKAQGNFGELRLQQLLESMDLEEGTQFETQVTLKDASGKTVRDEESEQRKQPDAILHFPDERDIIIDSKMSLTAYVDYQDAQTDEERADALKRHIASVRSHVNELSKKDYSRYLRNGHRTLDFVIMYVYHEGALQLALSNDATLWREAYDKKVIISGSQNLYSLLRVLEISWKQQRQAENQKEIMDCANEIISRTQLYYERVQKVEEQLDKTSKAFKDLRNVTASSGQSIVKSAKKLLEYGAQEDPKKKVRLPRTEVLGDGSLDDDDSRLIDAEQQ